MTESQQAPLTAEIEARNCSRSPKILSEKGNGHGRTLRKNPRSKPARSIGSSRTPSMCRWNRSRRRSRSSATARSPTVPTMTRSSTASCRPSSCGRGLGRHLVPRLPHPADRLPACWTRIFDGQLTSLGQRSLPRIREAQGLQRFHGSDLPVGTLADLRRLIDEVRKLSQFVDEEIPTNLRPAGSEPKTVVCPRPRRRMRQGAAVAVATGGASLFIEWAFQRADQGGQQGRCG